MNQLTTPTSTARYVQAESTQQMWQSEDEARQDRQPPATEIVVHDHADRMPQRHVGPGERRVALFEEGCDAHSEIGRLRQLGLRHRLELELLGEASWTRPRRATASSATPPSSAWRRRAAPPPAPARRTDRLRRPQRRGPSRGASAAFRRRPVVSHSNARADAEQATCEPRAARVGDEPDLDEGRDEARRVGRDPHIARKSE